MLGGVIRITRVSGKGCEELGRMGLLDTSRCCKICHSADGRAPPPPWGPVTRRSLTAATPSCAAPARSSWCAGRASTDPV